jgi:ribonuclease HI
MRVYYYVNRMELCKLQRLACLAIMGAMKTTPTAAMEVLLGLLPLHVIINVEAQAGIYRLMCNQQWRPRSTNYGQARKSWDREQEPLLLMGTDRMTPRYVFHKPLKVHLSNKHEWQNGLQPDIIGGLVWYTDGCNTNEGTGAGVYKWGSRKGHSISLGLHTAVFQAEMYAIKACIMENTEDSCKARNICILSDSQAAIKVLNNFQINSKLVWDCHQSLVRLTDHNRDQRTWMPGHTRIDGNGMADQLARQCIKIC